MKPQWYINAVLYLFAIPRKEKIAILAIIYIIYFLIGWLIADCLAKPRRARFTYHKYPSLFGISKTIDSFPKGYFSDYAKRKIKRTTYVAIPAIISYPFATLYMDDITLLKPGLTILLFILLMTPTAFSMLGRFNLYRMIFDEEGVIKELKSKREENKDERRNENDSITTTADGSGEDH